MNARLVLLIEEYKNATKLTFHVDELRNKIISFFLTFLGVLLAILMNYLKGDITEPSNLYFAVLFGIFVFIAWLLALVVIVVLARLRKVQLEYFAIINNIRAYFFRDDYKIWNVIQLSNKTLPQPSRKSGTYFWVFSIIIISSLFLPISLFILFSPSFSYEWICTGLFLTFVSSILLMDRIYLRFAKPPRRRIYSAQTPPFNDSKIETSLIPFELRQ